MAPSAIMLAQDTGKKLSFAAPDLDGELEKWQPIQRTRLWSLHGTLHCSIIGTCLTTSELRAVMRKAGVSDIAAWSDHDLHSEAVSLSGTKSIASKLLDKALERKHKTALDRFAKAKTTIDVQTIWREHVAKGDIPGGYWAVLTHAKSDAELIRRTFGEVHMLSHLVGAANRADIRKLHELEGQNANLSEKVHRQEVQLRDRLVERDAMIRSLKAALAEAVALKVGVTPSAPLAIEEEAASSVIANLNARLKRETANSERLETRLRSVGAELAAERRKCQDLERRAAELLNELDAVEASFPTSSLNSDPEPVRVHLKGETLLYVGGRANQIGHYKKLAEAHGAEFLHHDGGIEENSRSLAAAAARASTVLFPVDCVSHDAVATVKRVCRQLQKRFVPMRSAGLTSFAAVLTRLRSSTEVG